MTTPSVALGARRRQYQLLRFTLSSLSRAQALPIVCGAAKKQVSEGPLIGKELMGSCFKSLDVEPLGS